LPHGILVQRGDCFRGGGGAGWEGGAVWHWRGRVACGQGKDSLVDGLLSLPLHGCGCIIERGVISGVDFLLEER